jgi:hypothetical protein
MPGLRPARRGAKSRVTRGAAAYLGHRIPGRARLHVPDRRGDAAFFAQLAGAVRGIEGIERVEVNPRTGSLLLHHNGDLEPILERVQAARLLRLGEEPAAGTLLTAKLRAQLRELSGTLVRASGGQIDPRSAAILFFLIAGLVQLARGQIFAPATTLLRNASSLLAATPQPDQDTSERDQETPDG